MIQDVKLKDVQKYFMNETAALKRKSDKFIMIKNKGFVKYYEDSFKIFILYIFVKEEYRGKGLGVKMINHLNKKKTIELFPANIELFNYYTSLGFTWEGSVMRKEFDIKQIIKET